MKDKKRDADVSDRRPGTNDQASCADQSQNIVAIEPAQLAVHAVAAAFPIMDSESLSALAEDIKEHGLLAAVMVDGDGQVLDGRCRLKACEIAGVEPHYQTYGGNDPVGFIISANLKRRHMNESQRALVASRIATLSHGGDRRSDQAANLHLDIPKASVAAALLNVSERSLAYAAAVRKHGTAEIINDVETGKITVSAAAQKVKPPKQKPKPEPKSKPQPVIYIARIKSAFSRLEKAAADGDAKRFQRELHPLIEAATEQLK